MSTLLYIGARVPAGLARLDDVIVFPTITAARVHLISGSAARRRYVIAYGADTARAYAPPAAGRSAPLSPDWGPVIVLSDHRPDHGVFLGAVALGAQAVMQLPACWPTLVSLVRDINAVSA